MQTQVAKLQRIDSNDEESLINNDVSIYCIAYDYNREELENVCLFLPSCTI